MFNVLQKLWLKLQLEKKDNGIYQDQFRSSNEVWFTFLPNKLCTKIVLAAIRISLQFKKMFIFQQFRSYKKSIHTLLQGFITSP